MKQNQEEKNWKKKTSKTGKKNWMIIQETGRKKQEATVRNRKKKKQ